MTQAGETYLARLRREFEGVEPDHRSVSRAKLGLTDAKRQHDITEGERSEARDILFAHLRRADPSLLTVADQMLLQYAAKPPARSRDDVVHTLRERNHDRVQKGADALGVPVEQLSNRQRRLLAAVSDLPPEVERSRDRSEGDLLSRHLTALRMRLDWLVHVEEEHGDEQKGCNFNRAERNALIFVLHEQAHRAGLEAAKPLKVQRYETSYIQEVEDMARAAIEDGYTVTDLAKPAVLSHRNAGLGAASITVPMNVWFAVRGYALAKESE